MVIVCSLMALHFSCPLIVLRILSSKFSSCKLASSIACESLVFSNGCSPLPIVDKTSDFDALKNSTRSCRVDDMFDLFDRIHRKASAFSMRADILFVLGNVNTIYLVLGYKRLNPGIGPTHGGYNVHRRFRYGLQFFSSHVTCAWKLSFDNESFHCFNF